LVPNELKDLSVLGFSVGGYFDLRDCEPIDKTRPPRWMFPSILIRNGRMITDHDELVELWKAGEIDLKDDSWPRPAEQLSLRRDEPGSAT